MPLSLAEKLFGTPLKQTKSQAQQPSEIEKLDEMPPFSPAEQKILAEFLSSIPADFKLNFNPFNTQSGSLELSQSLSKLDIEERLSKMSRDDAEEFINMIKECRSSNAQ